MGSSKFSVCWIRFPKSPEDHVINCYGHSIMMFFDCTSRTSFNYIEEMRETLRAKLDNHPRIVLVATKVDLAAQRQVSEAEGRALADSWKAPYYECSCLTGLNVREAFERAVRLASAKNLWL